MAIKMSQFNDFNFLGFLWQEDLRGVQPQVCACARPSPASVRSPAQAGPAGPAPGHRHSLLQGAREGVQAQEGAVKGGPGHCGQAAAAQGVRLKIRLIP